jgi:hypothetical protein
MLYAVTPIEDMDRARRRSHRQQPVLVVWMDAMMLIAEHGGAGAMCYCIVDEIPPSSVTMLRVVLVCSMATSTKALFVAVQ